MMQSMFDPRNVGFSAGDVAKLRALSNACLIEKDRFITSKGQPAPSGALNDYVTMAPYWTVSGDRKDGVPQHGDGRLQCDTGRFDRFSLQRLCIRFYALGLDGLIFRNSVSVEKSRNLLKDWFVDPDFRMNPNPRFAQMRPDRTESNDVGLVEFRELIWIFTLIKHCGGIVDADLQNGLVNWVRDFVACALSNGTLAAALARENNIGVWVCALTAVLHDFAGEDAVRRQVLQIALDKHDKQIGPDGGLTYELQRTRPLHYSLFSLAAWVCLNNAFRHSGGDLFSIRSRAGTTVEDAVRFCSTHRRDFADHAAEAAVFDRRIGTLCALIYRRAGRSMPVFTEDPNHGFPPVVFAQGERTWIGARQEWT
jgi:hypothetical protein